MDVVTALILKYGPAIKRKWILREWIKNIQADCFWRSKLSGRQKHNAKWMAIYNDFVVGYESGMTMVEIAKRNNVSERTIYRYKAYYDKLREKEE